jgi:hypothetical protein
VFDRTSVSFVHKACLKLDPPLFSGQRRLWKTVAGEVSAGGVELGKGGVH